MGSQIESSFTEALPTSSTTSGHAFDTVNGTPPPRGLAAKAGFRAP